MSKYVILLHYKILLVISNKYNPQLKNLKLIKHQVVQKAFLKDFVALF